MATLVSLSAGPLSVDLDTRGAVIAGFRWHHSDGQSYPLMRENPGYRGDPLTAGCFPLLPFGNRVRDNRFRFDDTEYVLAPNQSWDRHYLHGDGWLAEWEITGQSAVAATFSMKHIANAASPYSYEASMRFSLDGYGLEVGLSVCNRGPCALPFGLGLHPYFPLTTLTSLQAAATTFYLEEAEFMPGKPRAVPGDLDFRRARALPRHWINNGFSGWNGSAEIAWPERNLCLRINADPAFRDYFVFMSDQAFEPGFAGDYFCFEPMTHCADGHHKADHGGLSVLAPGQALSAAVSFLPYEILSPGRSIP